MRALIVAPRLSATPHLSLHELLERAYVECDCCHGIDEPRLNEAAHVRRLGEARAPRLVLTLALHERLERDEGGGGCGAAWAGNCRGVRAPARSSLRRCLGHSRRDGLCRRARVGRGARSHQERDGAQGGGGRVLLESGQAL